MTGRPAPTTPTTPMPETVKHSLCYVLLPIYRDLSGP